MYIPVDGKLHYCCCVQPCYGRFHCCHCIHCWEVYNPVMVIYTAVIVYTAGRCTICYDKLHCCHCVHCWEVDNAVMISFTAVIVCTAGRCTICYGKLHCCHCVYCWEVDNPVMVSFTAVIVYTAGRCTTMLWYASLLPLCTQLGGVQHCYGKLHCCHCVYCWEVYNPVMVSFTAAIVYTAGRCTTMLW